MCGFYSLNKKITEIEKRNKLKSTNDLGFNPTYKITKGNNVPAILSRDSKIIQIASWGFNFDFSNIPIQNARKEKLLDTTSAWNEQLRNGNFCILPADSYYEFNWQDSKGKQKIPFRIGYKGFPLIGLAGLYRKGSKGFETTTITMDATGHKIGEIHNGGSNSNRAPFMLLPEQWNQWLNPKNEEEVLKMIDLEEENKFDYYSISSEFNSPNADPFHNWHQSQSFNKQGKLF